MRSLVILVAVLLMAVSAQAFTEREYQSEFTKFMVQFNKRYSAEELFLRYENFKSKLDSITSFNARGEGFTLGINEFSDMTSAERKVKMNGYRAREGERNEAVLPTNFEIPESIDWRSKGAVTAIKNQGQCGSCWSFSATGSMEGAHEISTGSLVSLSEQQLMDCSTAEGDDSCEGGLMDYAFEYVIKNGGICSEAEYPYVAKDETCKTGCTIVTTISSYVDVTSMNETALAYAVAQQPVSIAIEADQDVFQDYQSGILNSTACGTNLDHGVLLVGYGVDNTTNQEYWILKNSWGTSWGMKGYAFLAKGVNECGLAMDPSYPVV